MANNDMMAPEFRRLLKADGHLGALWDYRTNTLRLVCRDGTVDYDLNAMAEREQRKSVPMVAGQE